MGLQRGRGCSRPRFTPAALPGMLPPGQRFPTLARQLRALSSTTLTFSKEVLVTRGLVPTVWVRQASTGTAGLCAWFISAGTNNVVGRCWGKARTVRFPTQSTNRTETWFAVIAYTEQLGENSAGRGTALLVCATEGCGPWGPIPPCALQVWGWACSGYGRWNRLHHGTWTRFPSLNRLFYTMYKEMQTVPPATSPVAPGTPAQLPTPSGEERGPGPHHDMPPAAGHPWRG